MEVSIIHNNYKYERFINACNIELKSTAFSVYSILLHMANKTTKQCFPKYNTLASFSKYSKRTIIRAIKELEEKGLIIKEHRYSEEKNGSQTSNLYTIVIPKEIENKVEDFKNVDYAEDSIKSNSKEKTNNQLNDKNEKELFVKEKIEEIRKENKVSIINIEEDKYNKYVTIEIKRMLFLERMKNIVKSYFRNIIKKRL